MSAPVTHAWRFDVGDGTKVECDIYFLGLDSEDDAKKIRGMELTGAWINEAKDISKGVLDMIAGRVDRYPAKKIRNWTGVILDTNMPDDDHWLYRLAEVSRPKGWSFYRQPGGVIKVGEEWVLNPDRENIAHLSDRYYTQQLGGKSDEWIRVYLGAQYGYVSDGRPVFPEYSDVHHVVEAEPYDERGILIGADLGLTPAAVFAQEDTWGRYVIIDELVTDDVGAKDFALAIKRFMAQKFPGYAIEGAWGDPIGEKRQSGDDDIRTTFQIMAANGIKMRPAPGNNQFVKRREAVAGPLMRHVDGKPGLMIARRCIKLRAGMSGKYCFKRVAIRSEVYADQPSKGETSHVCEALQYLMLGRGEGQAAVTQKNQIIQRPTVITGTKFRHHVARRRVKSGRQSPGVNR